MCFTVGPWATQAQQMARSAGQLQPSPACPARPVFSRCGPAPRSLRPGHPSEPPPRPIPPNPGLKLAAPPENLACSPFFCSSLFAGKVGFAEGVFITPHYPAGQPARRSLLCQSSLWEGHSPWLMAGGKSAVVAGAEAAAGTGPWGSWRGD